MTNKTVELLRNVKGELSEQELTTIVDKVYENGYSPASQQEFEKGLNNSDIAEFAEKIIAGTHIAWTDVNFRKNQRTNRSSAANSA